MTTEGNPPASEDTAGLKSALQKERDRVKELQDKLKAFGNITPEQAQQFQRSQSEEIAMLRQQIEQLEADRDHQLQELKTTHEKALADAQAALVRKDASYQFSTALTKAEILPEYLDRFTDIESRLTVDKGQLMLDGQPFDAGSLRSKYPALFKAPPQTPGVDLPSGSPPATNGVRIVSGDDMEAIAALDPADVASGKILIR